MVRGKPARRGGDGVAGADELDQEQGIALGFAKEALLGGGGQRMADELGGEFGGLAGASGVHRSRSVGRCAARWRGAGGRMVGREVLETDGGDDEERAGWGLARTR